MAEAEPQKVLTGADSFASEMDMDKVPESIREEFFTPHPEDVEDDGYESDVLDEQAAEEDVAEGGGGAHLRAVTDSNGQSEWLPTSTDAVVKKINDIAVKTVERGFEGIGEFCLGAVFNFDLVAASSRNPRKEESFSAICSHPDLLVDPRRLGEAVKAAALSHLLKERGLELKNLSFTHKLHLSKIVDQEQRIALAIEASEKGYSVTQLRELIAQSLPKGKGELGKAIVKAIARPNETLKRPDYLEILKNSEKLATQITKADRIDLRVKSARARQELLQYCEFLQRVENSLFDIEVTERRLSEESPEDLSEEAV
jgi:hypothetical protein